MENMMDNGIAVPEEVVEDMMREELTSTEIDRLYLHHLYEKSSGRTEEDKHMYVQNLLLLKLINVLGKKT